MNINKINPSTLKITDMHFADIDGVLCIPREIAYKVLLRAEGVEKYDE